MVVAVAESGPGAAWEKLGRARGQSGPEAKAKAKARGELTAIMINVYVGFVVRCVL